ncbi:IS3 family transposase, partial [Listeria seeligeri]|uniref:IS3 family transposase n=3 Tax=Listeriaceae TaxID=186820 RepID=UPI0022EBF73F
PRTVKNQQIKKHILSIYMESKKRLGAAKVKVVLERDYGISISVGRVYRLMKSMNLPKMSTTKPKFSYTKPKVSLACPNHLNQQFNPTEPNRVWTSDISYIPVKNRFVYLCVILDLYSRKVIAWKVRTRMTTSLVLDTLQTALDKRQPAQPLLFHTDRGTQYTSSEMRQFLDYHSLTYSYSKKGYPWDNAVTESFFKYMKKEELDRRVFKTIQEVTLSSFEYIEGFYNPKRPHSANNMLTPNQKERNYFESL